MASLLTTQTTDTTGSAESHTGPCTAWVSGAPDGCTVVIQGSPTTNSADFVKLENGISSTPVFKNRTGCVAVDGQGTYYLRAVLENAGSSTSISVTTTQ